MSPESILDPLPIDRSAKADAWDAFHESQEPEEFQQRMDLLPLPKPAKADLWDMKFAGGTTPAPEPAIAEPEEQTEPEQPEPVKPNSVQRVSPDTPNPPTAALPTVPEKPETLDLQLQQLAGGHRKAVMFPKGTPPPPMYPPGVAVTHDGFGNVYAYRPDLVKKSAIHHAAANNTLPQLLGSAQMGMGAPNKPDLQGPPIVVAARNANGVEAQSTATDAQNLPITIEATRRVTPYRGRIELASPTQVVKQRTLGNFGTPQAL